MYNVITVLFIVGCIIFFILNVNSKAKANREKEQADFVDGKKEPQQAEIQDEESRVPDALKELYSIALNPTKQDSPVLYALITCHHCARMQRYLKEEQVEFHIVHADLFDTGPREKIMTVLKEYNNRGSFPTLIMPNGTTVAGFRLGLLKEALENDNRGTH